MSTIAVLDGVRAFACLCVIAYHINYLTLNSHIWTYHGVGPVLSGFALAGSYGVTLFFILSGFLLFMPYAKSLLFDLPWPAAKRYYLRRIFRILPGYYISLAILLLFLHPEYLHLDHWKQLLLFGTFFMDSAHSTYQAINGPFWTLAVEWQFYMLLPLLVLGMRWIVQRGSLHRRLITLSLSLCVLLIWGFVTRLWGNTWMAHPSQPMLLPAWLHHIALFFLYGQNGKYLEDFAIGMMICMLYILAQQQPAHVLSLTCKKYSRLIWIIGLGVLFFAAVWPFTSLIGPLRPYFGAHNWLSELPYGMGFGVCVLALLFGPPDLKVVLEWRCVRWIGQLSYGMYIWHLPFILLFEALILPILQQGRHFIIYIAYWLILLITLIPFCALFHNWIEQPWIKLGNAIITDRIRVE